MSRQLTQAEKIELQDNYDKAVLDILLSNTQGIIATASKLAYIDEYEFPEEVQEEKDYIKEMTNNITNLIKDYMNATRKRGL